MLAWNCDFTDRSAPIIHIQFSDLIEFAFICNEIEKALLLITREGYSISVEGLCNKAPQGINWRMSIEFESMQVALAVDAMMQKFGSAGG